MKLIIRLAAIAALTWTAIAQTRSVTVTGTLRVPTLELVSGTCSIQAAAAFAPDATDLRIVGAPSITRFTGGQLSVTVAATPVGSWYRVACSSPTQIVGGRVIQQYAWPSETWYVPYSPTPVRVNDVVVAPGSLVLPPWPTGPAGTIAIGTVTTVDPTTPAAVTNVGTPTAAVLNFWIPKGVPGAGGGTGGTTDHAQLLHLDYATSGHIGFAPTVHTHSWADLTNPPNFDLLYPRLDTGYANPPFVASLDWIKLYNVPSFAPAVHNHDTLYVRLGTVYNDPPFVGSLDYNKLINVPTVGGGTGNVSVVDSDGQPVGGCTAATQFVRDTSTTPNDLYWCGASGVYQKVLTSPINAAFLALGPKSADCGTVLTGNMCAYFDSATATLQTKDAVGNKTTTLVPVPTPSSDHKFLSYIDASGQQQRVRPAATDIAGLPLSCQPVMVDVLNLVPVATYGQTNCLNDTGATVTITAIRCYADTTGSTLTVTNGAGTALLTAAIPCSPTWAAGTQSSTVTIAANDFLQFTFVADGTATQTTWAVTETK